MAAGERCLKSSLWLPSQVPPCGQKIKMYFLTLVEARSPKSGSPGNQAVAHGEKSFLVLPAISGCQHLLACGHIFQSLCLIFTSPSSVCVILLPSCDTAGCVRVLPDNPEQPTYFKILILITSAKTLSPNKVTFTVSRD